MKHKFGIIIGFIVAAVVVGLVYHAGRQRKPLVYEFIPTNTIDWITQLTTFNTVNISVVDKGPFNWDNEDDFGQESGTDWQNVDTDPNFIVYYKNDAMHLNVQNARRVLQIANEALPELQELMGRYPYPEDCNGRKLAIYITSTPAEYQATIDQLMGRRCNSAGSVGMFICHIGQLGCRADGIVLNPLCFDYETSPMNWAETVLRHEMNHFVFFSSLDYGKEIDHPLWVAEGLAEFSAKPKGQVAGMDSILFIRDNCDVLQEFPRENNSEYWAGKSFYTFVEQVKGRRDLRVFIQDLYENHLKTALDLSFNDAGIVDSLWVSTLLEPFATDSTAVVPDEGLQE